MLTNDAKNRSHYPVRISFSPIIAPLISTVLFMLGSGYLTTFISIRMSESGHSDQAIGMVASAFYIGLVIGGFQISKLIVKIGHLRVFTIFVGTDNQFVLFFKGSKDISQSSLYLGPIHALWSNLDQGYNL